MDIMIVDGKSTKFHKVSIPDLISIQCHELTKILTMTVEQTIKADNEFKAKFKDDKLIAVFSCSSYYWQKIMEAIRSCHSQFGLMHLDLLEEVANKMESGTIARYGSIDSNDFVKHSLDDFRYAINRLRDFFAGGEMNGRDAAVFSRELDSQRKSLEEAAREIDDTFCHDAEGNPLPWAPPKPDPNIMGVTINLVRRQSEDVVDSSPIEQVSQG